MEMTKHFINNLKLEVPVLQPCACLRLPVILPEREFTDYIYQRSCEMGLGIGRMYPTAISMIEAVRPEFYTKSFPFSEMIAQRLVTIPTHRYVSGEVRKAICGLFNELYMGKEFRMHCRANGRYREQSLKRL